MEQEVDSNLYNDTDSDTADKKDASKCKVKWTLEEVSEKKTFVMEVSVDWSVRWLTSKETNRVQVNSW